MGVKWTSIALLVALVIKIHCLLEESPQSLTPVGGEGSITGKDKPLLQEFFDHAEYKKMIERRYGPLKIRKGLASKEEETMENPSTTELPEVLPTPVAVKQDKSDSEAPGTEKKFSVPKKGVPSKKPSVVPKKEVHFTPSVVAKKGADPESSTPSVSPRKGVKLSQSSVVHNLLLVSSENMNNTNVALLSSDNMDSKNVPTRIDETKSKPDSEKEIKQNVNNIPIPQLLQKGKSVDALFSVKANSSQPLSDSASKLSAVIPSKSESVSNFGHLKPTTADDVGAASSQVSYAPIFMIVALVVLLVVVVAVGYHKLKDIWVRRHYDYVDFLIDGMYE